MTEIKYSWENSLGTPKEVFEYLTDLVKELPLDDTPPQLTEDSDYYDPTITMGDFGIILSPVANSKGEEEESEWFLYREVVIPGVRYLPDGSGIPDESDLIEIGRFTDGKESAEALIVAVFKGLVEYRRDIMLENAYYAAFSESFAGDQ